MQHPGNERGFCLLYQSIHGDQSSAFYSLLHMAELLLDVSESLLPRSFSYSLPIRGWFIAHVFTRHPLIAILSGVGLASFSFSTNVSRKVVVFLFVLRMGIAAFAGLSRPLWALHLSGEFLKLSQQTLVDSAERLHLIGISLYGFRNVSWRSTVHTALMVLRSWGVGVALAHVSSRYHRSLRIQFYL